MLFEAGDLPAAMKSNKRRIVKTDPAARGQNLRGTNSRYSPHRVPARLFDPLQKLESGEMGISHEDHHAFHSLLVQGGHLLQFFDLILITHGDQHHGWS